MIVQNDGEIEDVNHRIQAEQLKWRSASCVSCDTMVPLGNFLSDNVRPTMLYDANCWVVKNQHKHKISAAEMRLCLGCVARLDETKLKITTLDLG